jgi:hypothetical protein
MQRNRRKIRQLTLVQSCTIIIQVETSRERKATMLGNQVVQTDRIIPNNLERELLLIKMIRRFQNIKTIKYKFSACGMRKQNDNSNTVGNHLKITQ